MSNNGPVVLHQKEDGSVQLRDNLSFLWCSCGKPAVEQIEENKDTIHEFKCITCFVEQTKQEAIQKLKELCSKVTPGPWMEANKAVIASNGNPLDFDVICNGIDREEDKKFIVAVRNYMPYLLKQLEQQQREIEWLKLSEKTLHQTVKNWQITCNDFNLENQRLQKELKEIKSTK
jgi:hypothetical protein